MGVLVVERESSSGLDGHSRNYGPLSSKFRIQHSISELEARTRRSLRRGASGSSVER